jgi:hypothetical protein
LPQGDRAFARFANSRESSLIAVGEEREGCQFMLVIPNDCASPDGLTNKNQDLRKKSDDQNRDVMGFG